MKRRDKDVRKGGGRLGLSKRAFTLLASLLIAALMLPGTSAAYAEEQVSDIAPMAEIDDYIEFTPWNSVLSSGAYRVTRDWTIHPGWKENAILVERYAKVLLYIDEGVTLTVYGSDAEDNGVGHAAILLMEGSTLTIAGKGTLNATGGNAGSGSGGGNAGDSEFNSGTGRGGSGGNGGGGAGAGIGTNGGSGGNGGAGGVGVRFSGGTKKNIYGNAGESGSAGSQAATNGTVIVTGSVTVNAKGGSGGSGGSGGKRGMYSEIRYPEYLYADAAGTSGGGGGGGGGGAADGIGSGGTGGGGGGGGASGNVDGELCLLDSDLDDLWGYGGHGGSSSWGGSIGNQGDYGASNGGDDTGASKKYARSGGAGGSSTAPRAVTFYTYKDSPSSSPTVNCISGHGVSRAATPLDSIDAFKIISGLSAKIIGGTFTYDGAAHGATVEVPVSADSDEEAALTAEDDEEWPNSGSWTETIDGVEVTFTYSISYYDEAGRLQGDAPVMPGRYLAVASIYGSDGTSTDLVAPVTITKIQVEVPTPAELTFACKDWETGAGITQDAFPGLNNTGDYEFVTDAKADDGTVSARAASDVGSYAACFKLKDPTTHQWADESEDASEVWVTWSIAPSYYDPNDAGVTYWGTAHNNTTTSVAFSGSPIWVRPFFAPTRDAGGEFPEWVTHWGEAGRPTTNRRSAIVVYLNGKDDHEGIVGYHENPDGSLEPVTGVQVSAWMFGVEIGGEHVAVENGDKVWYRTDDDGWIVPLAVQDERPEGAAEGNYVVARDPAYATRLGVRDPGVYQAYAFYDEGAGFAPTAPAEAIVEVSPISFSDVTDKVAHHKDIAWLVASGISKGWNMPDGTVEFRPYASTERTDMAAFLYRLAKSWGLVDDSWQPKGDSAFIDVTDETPHYREVMWLAESGISRGWDLGGKKVFRPYASVTRADTAAFLRRLADLAGISDNKDGGASFKDVTAETAHTEDIAWLAATGISKGWAVSGGYEFRPYSNIARADMAAFLHRLNEMR